MSSLTGGNSNYFLHFSFTRVSLRYFLVSACISVTLQLHTLSCIVDNGVPRPTSKIHYLITRFDRDYAILFSLSNLKCLSVRRLWFALISDLDGSLKCSHWLSALPKIWKFISCKIIFMINIRKIIFVPVKDVILLPKTYVISVLYLNFCSSFPPGSSRSWNRTSTIPGCHASLCNIATQNPCMC